MRMGCSHLHFTEEALKKAPNIKEVAVLVIPHVARMWCAIGRFLGIIKAILTAIESEARKKVSLKQTCEMFQLWLDGREGTGDEERSWFVILRVLMDIGRSDIIFEIQEHFDLKTKDIARGKNVPCNELVCIYTSVCAHTCVFVRMCVFVCMCVYIYLCVDHIFYYCLFVIFVSGSFCKIYCM